MIEPNRKVVLGLGNILNSDEGSGVHALNLLTNTLRSYPDEIEFLDGGTLGINLLPLIESCRHLLILDSVNAGQAPGCLIELTGKEIPLYTKVKLSQHQITFQEVLALACFRNKLPSFFHLIGLQPADFSAGIGMSPRVAAAVPRVVDHAILVLREWGLLKLP